MRLDYADPVHLLAALGARAPGVGKIVWGGQRYEVPGLAITTFLDNDPCTPETRGHQLRALTPQSITIHATKGEPREPLVTADAAQSTAVCALGRYQATAEEREVGWDFTVSTRGTVHQASDPVRYFTWQAGGVNPRSIGIEIEQGPGGIMSPASIRAAVMLVDALTRLGAIQRQIPAVRGPGGGLVPDRRVLARFRPEEGSGRDWVGEFGHRNVTDQRGPGDPGDPIMWALLAAGYEGFDLAAGEDLYVWQIRQQMLGVAPTGVPTRETAVALLAAGYPHGILVWRPGD